MAEDPLCTHEPGRFAGLPLIQVSRAAVEYGHSVPAVGEIAWDDDARERMKRIPAFVRGMVVKAVESYCATNGIGRVTPAELEKIRSRMPTGRVFR